MEQTASRPTKADPVQPARFGALARLRSPAAWTVLAAGFALVPPVLMAVFIGQHSVNTVSNDYLRFLSLADRALSAGYDWSGYFRDSFDNNVHSYAFLFLFRLALAALSRMSL